MTDVLIKRELLERLETWVTDDCEALRELQAILAAPRQPDGDHGWLVSLELPELQCNCAWNPDSHDKACPAYLRDRMADAQRAIAELREECSFLKECQENAMLHMTGLVAERDTLRQQLAERDAEIMEQCRLNGMGAERELKLLTQRDKLSGLLREAIPDVEFSIGEGYKESAALFERINAALAKLEGKA